MNRTWMTVIIILVVIFFVWLLVLSTRGNQQGGVGVTPLVPTSTVLPSITTSSTSGVTTMPTNGSTETIILSPTEITMPTRQATGQNTPMPTVTPF